MFDFLGMSEMLGNSKDRKVDRYERGDLFVSTVYVTDGRKDYETAVAHPDYNNGDIIIVECYDTKEEAQHGHNSWVVAMRDEPLPDKLTDCVNAEISQLLESAGGEMEHLRQN